MSSICRKDLRKITVKSIKINENQQKSKKINEILSNSMKSDEIFENTRSFDELAMALTHSKRCTECPNTRISLGNEFPTKKYIEAVVRKSSGLQILAEIDHFENLGRV